jgi:hypothetical protein
VLTADGPTRVSTRLHDARQACWQQWELPVLGEVAAPPAVLIRPDGHVAWAGDLMDPELPQALATWFGAANPAHRTRRPSAPRPSPMAVGGTR